jgi:hypothetical protein
MMQAIYQHDPQQPIQVFDAATLPWQPTPEPGLRLKCVRYDNERGLFLGLIHFAPLARSGLHQHRGVATSFIANGGLTDYHGPVHLHQAGINLVGSTHDAIAYQECLLVSRLEGPVVYPPERGELTGLHAGSRHAAFVNPAPEVPPEVNVDVDAVALRQTGVQSLQRQTIFDYAGTGSAHRFVQWRASPGMVCPPWRASALTELWVRGGLININGRTVHGNCFVVIEAGAEVTMASPFGALVLAWAEGPEHWATPPSDASRSVTSSLFGF